MNSEEYSSLMGTRSNADCVMMTASGLLSADWAMKRRRLLVWKFCSSATMIWAVGYSSRNSRENCASMWLGTTYQGRSISPRRFCSMPAAIIVNVLPAPTACAR
ncbi:hypothetical protein D3C87_1963050 [compost metagenome]